MVEVPNIDLQSYLEQLERLQIKSNHLQELMIAKAFSGSPDVSKAINYMNQLSETRQEFIRRGQRFADQQLEIMATFELLQSDKNTDDMLELNNELRHVVDSICEQIQTWLHTVFQGDSSDQALKAIVE